MSRFDELITTVEAYQALAAENYARVRQMAEEIRAGLEREGVGGNDPCTPYAYCHHRKEIVSTNLQKSCW